MRLIDADEVLKRWGLKFYAMGGDRLGPNGDEISFYVNGLLNEIQNAPTVDTYTEDDVQYAIKEGHQVGYEMTNFKSKPIEIIKESEPISNSDEISRNLELAEIIRQMERLADKGEDICIEIEQVRYLLALLKELAIYRLKEAEK